MHQPDSAYGRWQSTHRWFVEKLVEYNLFKGKTLVEELAFVRYFHYHPVNVALHIIGFHFLYLVFLFALSRFSAFPFFPEPLQLGGHVLVHLCYCTGFILLDIKAGLLGAACLTAVFVALHALILTASASTGFVVAALAVSLALGGGLQLVGHIAFDKSQPAFRPFEAFFTTPFYLYLFILMNGFGYKKQLRADIAEATKMWRGSERVLYGPRPFAEHELLEGNDY